MEYVLISGLRHNVYKELLDQLHLEGDEEGSLKDGGTIHYSPLILMVDLFIDEEREIYRGRIHCRPLLMVDHVPNGIPCYCHSCGGRIEKERRGVAVIEEDTVKIKWKHELSHIIK